jgi:hypothetical protein
MSLFGFDVGWGDVLETGAEVAEGALNVVTLGAYGAISGSPVTAMAKEINATPAGQTPTLAKLQAAYVGTETPARRLTQSAAKEVVSLIPGWLPWLLGAVAVGSLLFVATPYVSPILSRMGKGAA